MKYLCTCWHDVACGANENPRLYSTIMLLLFAVLREATRVVTISVCKSGKTSIAGFSYPKHNRPQTSNTEQSKSCVLVCVKQNCNISIIAVRYRTSQTHINQLLLPWQHIVLPAHGLKFPQYFFKQFRHKHVVWNHEFTHPNFEIRQLALVSNI